MFEKLLAIYVPDTLISPETARTDTKLMRCPHAHGDLCITRCSASQTVYENLLFGQGIH